MYVCTHACMCALLVYVYVCICVCVYVCMCVCMSCPYGKGENVHLICAFRIIWIHMYTYIYHVTCDAIHKLRSSPIGCEDFTAFRHSVKKYVLALGRTPYPPTPVFAKAGPAPGTTAGVELVFLTRSLPALKPL